MKKEFFIYLLSLVLILFMCIGLINARTKKEVIEITNAPINYEEYYLKEEEEPTVTQEDIDYWETVSENYVEDYIITDEVLYLAQCVEAEAGNQDEIGKRLVIDCILNRVDSDKFPNDIVEVINQKYQFAVVDNGMIEKVEVRTSTINLVLEEMNERYNSEVLYFRTDYYHNFGTELFKHQDHYFSK